MLMALEGSIAAFLVSWLVGSIGIYVGVELVTRGTSFISAAVTALLGAAVWGLTTQFLGEAGWGSTLALVAWILVITVRHRGGLISAIFIGIVSWIATLALLHLLAGLGIGTPPALGIPGL